MKKRTLLYTMIIILPAAALGFFGLRASAAEQRSWRTELSELYTGRIENIERDISAVLGGIESSISSLNYLFIADREEMRAAVRETDFIRQVFRIDAEGKLEFPAADGQNSDEEAFLERTSAIWESGQRFRYPDEAGQYSQAGWFPYYEADGVSFLYWMRDLEGSVLGFDVYREYIFYSILNRLAGGGYIDAADSDRKIILNDDLGRQVFMTGRYSPQESEQPFLSQRMAESLGGWTADVYLASGVMSPGRSIVLPVSIAVLITALLAGAFFFWREYTREIREAGKKVTFVNQVSHELKTPLTNIRMYAEMLADRLKGKGREKDYARVLCRESERLSRLISNVLSFSGKGGQLRCTKIDPSACVEHVVRLYMPGLEEKILKLNFSAKTDSEGLFDRDIIEQICWNLINNAEKYAAGAKLDISTDMQDGVFTADFADTGPGIPARNAEKVFEPFYRVRNDLTEGVSGSGLGLAISKALAAKHGGDLTLVHSGKGAHFRLVLAPGGKHEDTDS